MGVTASIPGLAAHWAPLSVSAARQAELAAWLAPAEADRAARYRQARDRRRFIVRRGRLRQLCADRLGCAPSQVPLAEGPFGKPFVEGASLRLNLSSSGDLALVVLAEDLDVGCDIEWRRPDLASRRTAERLFSPSEKAQLRAIDTEAAFTRAFFACWTRKEALIKGVGLGLSLPLEDFDVSVAPDCPAPLLSGPPGWSLRAFEPAPALHVAIAFRA